MKGMVKNRRMGHGKVNKKVNKKRAAKKKKIFAFLFIAVICVSFLPASVWAMGFPPTTSSEGSRGPGTAEIKDPIAASTGEYYFSKTFISLGGLIPLDFTLEYSPHMRLFFTFAEFPLPWIFVSNTWIRLLKFNDTSTTPETEYVNIQFLHDALIFKKNTGTGQWESQMEVKYQLKETENYFYMMDPTTELVYVFDKRHKTYGRVLHVMDRNGNKLTYSYNSDGQPTRIEDGLGRALNLNYNVTTHFLSEVNDSFGRTITFNQVVMPIPGTEWIRTVLTSVTDHMGNTTQFRYQYFADSGWSCYTYMTNQTLPEGNIPYEQTWAEKNLSGWERYRVVSQRDAYGNQVNLSYNESSGIVTVTNPDDTQRVFEHESGRWFKSRTDETGKSFTMDHDASHRPTKLTDRLGNTISVAYHDASGQIASITSAKGETINYTYTPQDQSFSPVTFTFYNLIKIDYPDGTNEQFTYDSKGNLIQGTDKTGKTWDYTYNDRGQLLTITNPAGGVIAHTYNADGTRASSTDSDTGITTYEYDAYKRLNKIIHPDSTFMQLAYNLNDQVTSIIDEINHTYTNEYDANGNLIKITDPAGEETQYTYDLMDRWIRITDRLGKITALTYDNMNRLASITDPNNIQVSYGYDPRGWLNQMTLGGQTWQIGYDDEGVVTSRTTPLGNTTTYQTNKLGYTTGIMDPLSQVTTFARDNINRITGITDPLNRTTQYSYDNRGLLSSATMPVIGTAIFQGNDLGQVAQITDLNGKNWTFGYTNMGRLQSHTDPLSNTWQHTYDSRGKFRQTTYPDSSTQIRTYDSAGNVIRRLYSDGTDLRFTYDELDSLVATNNLTLTRDAEGRVTDTENQSPDFGATYDDGGRLKTVTYNNGAFSVTYTYDATTGLLSKVTDSLTGTWIDLTYDNDGRMTGISRSNGVSTTLSWDNVSRLTRIQEGSIIDIQYTLDAAGQVTQVDMTAPLNPADYLAQDTDTFTYDDASQVNSEGYTYGERGRLTASPDHTYTWDGASRLTGIDGVTLTYNGLGDLITRTEGGTTIHYHHNYAIGLTPIVAEKDQDTGQFLHYYVSTPDGNLLYMIDAADGNKVYLYHFGQVGSTLALTDGDGNVTDSYAYTPYGRLLHHEGTSDQPFTYVGEFGVMQLADLYYMRARYYDPCTARFLSRDREWSITTNPLELNPYIYAYNNPLSYIDPMGMQGSKAKTLEGLGRLVGGLIRAGTQRSFKEVFQGIADSVLGRLGGRVKPNRAQIAQSVTKDIKIADILLRFIPGWSAIEKGDWAAFVPQVAWDIFAAPPASTVTLPATVMKNMLEYGEPNTHGVWSYGEIYNTYYSRYGHTWGAGYTVNANAIASYPRDAITCTYGKIVEGCDWLQSTFVDIFSIAPTTAPVARPYSAEPPGSYTGPYGGGYDVLPTGVRMYH